MSSLRRILPTITALSTVIVITVTIVMNRAVAQVHEFVAKMMDIFDEAVRPPDKNPSGSGSGKAKGKGGGKGASGSGGAAELTASPINRLYEFRSEMHARCEVCGKKWK